MNSRVFEPAWAGESPPELPWLTMVRFLPAAWVVVYHMEANQTLPAEWVDAAPAFVMNVVRHGYLGVAFFFMLSGFILSHAYGHKSSVRLRPFLEARIARIYPLHLFGLLLSIHRMPAWFRDHENFHSPILAHALATMKALAVLLLGQAWWEEAGLFWNSPAWSLSVEMFFYACFPFLLPWVRRLSILGVWGMLGGCAVALGLFEGLRLHSVLGVFNPALLLPWFLAGIGIHGLLTRRVAVHPLLAIPSLALFVLSFSAHIPGPVAYLPRMLGIGGIIAALAPLGVNHPGGKLRAFCVLLGQASFSMYLLHMPMLWILSDFAPLHGRVFIMVYLALVLAASILAFRYVESPMRDNLRRFFNGRRRGMGQDRERFSQS